jgi:tetratricopeptide (TPR) repeat protein
MDSAAQAVTVFQQAADAHQVEKAAVPYTQKGAILYNRKNYRTARGAYARALMLDPANMEALFFIGFTFEQTGAPAEARRAFKKYLKAAAGNPMLKTRVGLVEERLHKLPQER